MIDKTIKFFLVLIFSLFIPQIIKVIREYRKGKNLLEIFTETGGMPSSHSAIVSAITTYIYLIERFSTSFFIALSFALIVIKDATSVRYSVGEQSKKINLILKKTKIKTKDLKIIKGHTKAQAFVGILIGITISIIIYYI